MHLSESLHFVWPNKHIVISPMTGIMYFHRRHKQTFYKFLIRLLKALITNVWQVSSILINNYFVTKYFVSIWHVCHRVVTAIDGSSPSR